MSGVEAMIRAMEKWIGTGEPNAIQAWYCRNAGICGNFAWCDATVTYAAWDSGNEQAVTWGGYYAYTVAHAQKFSSKGQWHSDTAGIRRGDIVFFDWSGSNSISAIDHVGVVTDVQGSNVYTIEGNIDNVCKRMVRQANYIAGYGRPAYSDAPAPTPPPSSYPGPADTRPWVYKGQLEQALAYGKTAPTGARMYAWPQVLLVEQALNREGLLSSRYVDGGWGTTTTAAYAAWQRRLGYSGDAANGSPGVASLQRLADKYGTFRVGD